jgi:exonuclease-1
MLVFGGGRMPAMTPTNEARARKQHAAYIRMHHEDKEGVASLKLGYNAVKACISELRKVSIPYALAPYEADSQLLVMAKEGTIVDVASLDSDIIVHKVPRTFLKVKLSTCTRALVDMQNL